MSAGSSGTATDTIFAPATGSGRAGIAVIRISGPAAASALAALSCKVPPPRRAVRARFVDRATAEPIDDGLILFFPGPASVTGEDVAELHLHGSRAVIEAIVTVLAGEPGLRLAEPGEFTRRAFENGKLDLTAAEAIADLVAAETSAQRLQALRQLDGELGRLYDDWRNRLTRAAAHVEAGIDFPEEGLPNEIGAVAQRTVDELIDEIAAHLADGRRGEILRDGVSVAIVGPPNAGKSSLINMLAQREVAITAATAGTTRDVIEVRLDLLGYPVILADTAGLREVDDPIEAEGVRRARSRAESADLKIVVLDASRPDEVGAVAEVIDDKALVVVNKTDIGGNANSASWPEKSIPISVRTGEGVPALLEALGAAVRERFALGSQPSLTRARHRTALDACLTALKRSQNATLAELRAEDLRLAGRALGQITGRVDVEDLLDIIFRDFCIGK